MDARPLLDELSAQLALRGLPRAYIERFVAEYQDHLEDLIQERNQDMSTARMPLNSVADLRKELGDPQQLSAIAATHYFARNFFGRHPIFTFLIAPLPLLVALTIIATLAVVLPFLITGVPEFTAQILEAMPVGEVFIGTLLCWFLSAFPPLIAALLFCRMARRNALDWRWSTAACVLVAIGVGLINVFFRPKLPTKQGVFGLGLIYPTTWASWSLFLLKFAVASSIGTLLVWRSHRQLAPDRTPCQIGSAESS